MEAKKVKLKDVMDMFEMVSDECSIFFNRKTLEAEYVLEDGYGDKDEEDSQEKFSRLWHDKNIVPLPSKYELNDYRDMVLFIETLPEGEKKYRLYRAIQGKGAFRRFLTTAHCLGLLDDWYAFKNKREKEKAIAWLKENDIPYEE